MRTGLQNARVSLMDAAEQMRGVLTGMPHEVERATRRASLQIAMENAQSARRLVEYILVMDAAHLDEADPILPSRTKPRPQKRRAK